MYGAEMDTLPFSVNWQGGGGNGGGSMQSRMRKLEEDITKVQIDVAVIKSNYATKEDLGALREELKEDNRALREELRGEIGAFREEVKGDNRALKAELKGEIGVLHEEIKGYSSVFAKEINELKVSVSDTRALISEAKSSIILWVVSAVIFAQLIPAIPAILKVFFPS